MRLRDIDFGSVFDASGVRGFFGEGYWYHIILRPFGLDFRGSTFVAKTTTLLPRKGNMAMGSGYTPKEWFPRTIIIKPRLGAALNAVGLSGPGADALFKQGFWQQRTEPFFLSFAAVTSSRVDRDNEMRGFVTLLQSHIDAFHAPIGLQINVSCPNTENNEDIMEEALHFLDIASELYIPLVVKINVLTPPAVARAIALHKACDALCVSNTIPWGSLNEHIPWKKMFGSEISPLERYGGGGLSGAPLLPIVASWVKKAREAGIAKPIIAGGGVLQSEDVCKLTASGADAVFLGSIAFLRPWRVRKTIQFAKQVAKMQAFC